MGYSIYRVGKRWGGYGVLTFCEHPDCNKEIDRGMSYACGGEPFSEYGCDRYFCCDHKGLQGWKTDGSGKVCDHDDDCNCNFAVVCERCAGEDSPFDYKPEHPTWVEHLLTDESWSAWREDNPDEVKKLSSPIKPE